MVFIEQDSVLFENILDLFRLGKISQLAKLAKLKKSVKKFKCPELQEEINAEIKILTFHFPNFAPAFCEFVI